MKCYQCGEFLQAEDDDTPDKTVFCVSCWNDYIRNTSLDDAANAEEEQKEANYQ